MKTSNFTIFIFLLFFHHIRSQELFVEEAGENDFILIENDPEPIPRSKRQVPDLYSDDEEYSDDFESSGDAIMYDLDESVDEDDEDPYNEVTPVIPSRVVPTLVSPSFDDPGNFGNVVVTKMAPKKTALGAFDVIKTALYDDEFEGSGKKFLIILI